MKKILCLTSLALVFLLAACGGGGSSEETVCTAEDVFSGGTIIATFESRDNEIESATMVLRIDVSDWSEEMIQEEIENELMNDEGVEYEIDGNTLIFSQTMDGAGLAAEGLTRDLAEMVSEMERNGATCE